MTNFLRELPAALPSYMRGPILETLAGAVGQTLDDRAEQVLWGRLQGNPYAGGTDMQRTGAARLADGRLIECDPMFLPLHAAQRGITLYASEGPLSQRIRTSQWWQLHKARGTHWGEIAHVRPWFADTVAAGFAYPSIVGVFQSNEGTPAAYWFNVDPSGTRTMKRVSPSNFNYDGRPSLRSRVWWFIDMTGTGYTPPALWGGGWTWGDGTLWGVGGLRPFTVQAAADISAMLGLDWKSAHSWCGGVVVVWPGVGGATFPSAAGTPTQDASGWWNLPNGAGTWASLVLPPPDGRASRPPNFQWILDNPAP